MKTFFKVTMLGLLMVVFTAVSANTTLAQTAEELQAQKTAVYNKFMDHYTKPTIADKEIAIAAAKEYNSKFNKDEDKQLNDYFKGAITDLEKAIVAIKEAEKQAEIDRLKKIKEQARTARFSRLNNAYEGVNKSPNVAKNWDEFFEAGKKVLEAEPDQLDVAIMLATGGSDIPKELQNAKFDNLTSHYANLVIKQLDNGVKPKLKNKDGKLQYGAYKWYYNSKDSTMTWMNRILAELKAKTNKDSAIAYYYKATKFDTGSKDWNLYRLIGGWYYDQLAAKVKERQKIDKTNEENFPLIKESLAIEKGYAERAMDAYARAYRLARADAKLDAKKKKALFSSLQELFKFRYSHPKEAIKKTDASINSYVATIDKQAMPNPESQVMPVKSVEDENPSDKSDEMKKQGDAKTSEMKTGKTRSRTVSKQDN